MKFKVLALSRQKGWHAGCFSVSSIVVSEDIVLKNALIAVYILLVLSLAGMARASELPNPSLLNQGLSYQRFSESTARHPGLQRQLHIGELVQMEEGSFSLLLMTGDLVPLVSEKMLDVYLGKKVLISGIRMERNKQVAVLAFAKDPLPGLKDAAAVSPLFVLAISEAK